MVRHTGGPLGRRGLRVAGRPPTHPGPADTRVRREDFTSARSTTRNNGGGRLLPCFPGCSALRPRRSLFRWRAMAARLKQQCAKAVGHNVARAVWQRRARNFEAQLQVNQCL